MDEQHTLSRRGFVGAAAGAAAASAVTWAPGASARGKGRHRRNDRDRLLPRDLIGIQLFTVRDQVDSLGFEAVFAELSRQGYKEIEFAGYDAQGRRWTNEELRGLLRRYRLKGIGSHIGYTQFLNNLEQVLDDAEEIGLPYIGTANSPGAVHGETVEGYRRAAEDFNRFGAAARKRGMRFYQHNHDREFAIENGTRLYDVILEETDPKLVFFELDIFWAYVGQSQFPGFKPHEYPWFQPERFPLFHVKDGVMDGGPTRGWTMTDVGDGDIAFEPFFCGLEIDDHHYLVERDTAPDNPEGSFSTAERSYDYLAGLEERDHDSD
ncbi:MAG: sugar phosphate isomerase/epimerase family protein [Solirubrobacteraceae bacterium]